MPRPVCDVGAAQQETAVAVNDSYQLLQMVTYIIQAKDIPLLTGFLSSPFSVARRLAPAPLKLRPYSAIQVCLLMLSAFSGESLWNGTVSVCPSVCPVDRQPTSNSDVQPVCRSQGAGSRYRSEAGNRRRCLLANNAFFIFAVLVV